MNIHEYQSKELFKDYGIKTLKGKIAFSSEEAVGIAKSLDSDKWVVKAQIHAGGRGKGGGVKIAHSIEQHETFLKVIPQNELNSESKLNKEREF